MKNVKRLSELDPGERARVARVETESSLATRLADLGLITETAVECVGKSPFGDPAAYLIRGAVIAIRNKDAKNIIIY